MWARSGRVSKAPSPTASTWVMASQQTTGASRFTGRKAGRSPRRTTPGATSTAPHPVAKPRHGGSKRGLGSNGDRIKPARAEARGSNKVHKIQQCCLRPKIRAGLEESLPIQTTKDNQSSRTGSIYNEDRIEVRDLAKTGTVRMKHKREPDATLPLNLLPCIPMSPHHNCIIEGELRLQHAKACDGKIKTGIHCMSARPPMNHAFERCEA